MAQAIRASIEIHRGLLEDGIGQGIVPVTEHIQVLANMPDMDPMLEATRNLLPEAEIIPTVSHRIGPRFGGVISDVEQLNFRPVSTVVVMDPMVANGTTVCRIHRAVCTKNELLKTLISVHFIVADQPGLANVREGLVPYLIDGIVIAAAIDEKVDDHGFIQPGLSLVKRLTEKMGIEPRWSEYSPSIETQNLVAVFDGPDGRDMARKAVIASLLYRLEEEIIMHPDYSPDGKATLLRSRNIRKMTLGSLAWVSNALRLIEKEQHVSLNDAWEDSPEKKFFWSPQVNGALNWLARSNFVRLYDLGPFRVYFLTPEGADYIEKCYLPALAQSHAFYEISRVMRSGDSLLFQKPWQVYEHLMGQRGGDNLSSTAVGGD